MQVLPLRYVMKIRCNLLSGKPGKTFYYLKVTSRVKRVLVPAINILQSRTNSCPAPSNRDAALLETVRGRWCALLETNMSPEKNEHWRTVFNTVVPDDNTGQRNYSENDINKYFNVVGVLHVFQVRNKIISSLRQIMTTMSEFIQSLNYLFLFLIPETIGA